MADPSKTEDLEVISAGHFWNRGRWRSVLWLVVFASVLSLQVWFPRLDTDVNDTYNVDNGGRNALFQFVSRRLPSVTRSHEPLATRLLTLPPQNTLCLLGPARQPSPREWEALLNWVMRGGHLVVAAPWDSPEMSVPQIGLKINATGAKPADHLFGRDKKPQKKKSNSTAPTKDDQASETTPAVPLPPVDATRLLTADLDYTWKSVGSILAPTATVLVTSTGGVQAVRVPHGQGTIVVTASDYIFSNTALFEEQKQNGVLVVRLLEAAGTAESLVFDESLNETGTPRVVGLLLDPILRPATVQIVALLLLFGRWGNRRFGPLLRESRQARHDVSDHTNSLGNLYYKAHHGTGVLREYFEQLKTELKLRFSTAQEARNLQRIAEQAGLTLEEVQSRLKAAEAATRQSKLSRHVAAGHIRKLAELRQAHHKPHLRAPAPKTPPSN
ncbi:MAG: DUF4350 domain-containing protein [Planctomycetes bacterium]|nr:DUF4350 domain-containing protein [Planctomycetota bacterium]